LLALLLPHAFIVAIKYMVEGVPVVIGINCTIVLQQGTNCRYIKNITSFIFTRNLTAMQTKPQIPLFKSWRSWYILVIVVLVLLIIFFTWFTHYFS
jgi:hypothetical protein